MLPQRGLTSGAMSAPRMRTSETLGCSSGVRELNHLAMGPAPISFYLSVLRKLYYFTCLYFYFTWIVLYSISFVTKYYVLKSYSCCYVVHLIHCIQPVGSHWWPPRLPPTSQNHKQCSSEHPLMCFLRDQSNPRKLFHCLFFFFWMKKIVLELTSVAIFLYFVCGMLPQCGWTSGM